MLSNPALREKYDQEGKEELNGVDMMDPSAFFAMVFGSEEFEPLVGPLKLATMVGSEHEVSDEESSARQRFREVQCAVNLRELLQPYLHPNSEGSLDGTLTPATHDTLTTRAKNLASTPFGEELLHVIGYVYTLAGQKQLGRADNFGLAGHMYSLKQKGHIIGTQFDAFGAGVKAAWQQHKVSKEIAQKEQAKTSQESNPDAPPPEEDVSQEQRAAMMNMLEALWKISVLDIESTVRNACHKLLHDKSVDPTEINRRARALVAVGELFTATKCEGQVHALTGKRKTWKDHLAEQMAGPPPGSEDQQQQANCE